MKIRTDFVTNSSSSSFVSVTVINGEKSLWERFHFENCSEDLGHYNEWGVITKSGYESLPFPTSGTEILQNLEKFFRGGFQSGEAIDHSKLIKYIGNIDYGAVNIHQCKQYDSGEDEGYDLCYLIQNGNSIVLPKNYWSIYDLKDLCKLGESTIETEVVFNKVKNLSKVDHIIDGLKPGQKLSLHGSDDGYRRVLFNRTILGHLKDLDYDGFSGYFLEKYCEAEVINATPISKRKKGSKYPVLTIRIIKKTTVDEYIKRRINPRMDINIYVINDKSIVEEEFNLPYCSQTLGDSSWEVRTENGKVTLPLPTSGIGILQNVEKFCNGGLETGEIIAKSKSIKEIERITNGLVMITQRLTFDSYNQWVNKFEYLIHNGNPIVLDWRRSLKIRSVIEFSQIAEQVFETEVQFKGIKNIDKVDSIIEKIEPGQNLSVSDDEVYYGKTLLGYIRCSTMKDYSETEVIEAVPRSKRQDGDKYPLLRIRIENFTLDKMIESFLRNTK